MNIIFLNIKSFFCEKYLRFGIPFSFEVFLIGFYENFDGLVSKDFTKIV
jgi:hypothetical protein